MGGAFLLWAGGAVGGSLLLHPGGSLLLHPGGAVGGALLLSWAGGAVGGAFLLWAGGAVGDLWSERILPPPFLVGNYFKMNVPVLLVSCLTW